MWLGMNPKARELKINNFKKKIREKYDYLLIDNVYGPGEGESILSISKKAHNDPQCDCYHFPIFKNGVLIEENKCYENAFNCFHRKVQEFNKYDKLIFPISFNGEVFRVECNSKKFISNISQVVDLYKFPYVIDSGLKHIVSIMKLEYEIEVCVLDMK